MEEGDDLDGTDPFFLGVVGELERRKILERTGRIAAEIEIDLESKGPLGLYAEDRRRDAADALRALAGADPRDAVAIAELQGTVKEYLRVFEWVGGWMDRAAQAEQTIKQEYDRDETDSNED